MVLLSLVIYHGGWFEKGGFHYCGGAVHKEPRESTDLTVENIRALVDMFGYRKIDRINFRTPNRSMRILWKEDSLRDALVYAQESGRLELYVEHSDELSDDDQSTVNPSQCALQLSCRDNVDDILYGNIGDELIEQIINEGMHFRENVGIDNDRESEEDDDNIRENMQNNEDGVNVENENISDSDKEDEYEYDYGDLEDEADSLVDIDVMTDDEEHIDTLLNAKKVRKGKSFEHESVTSKQKKKAKNMVNTRRTRAEEFLQDERNQHAHSTNEEFVVDDDEEGGAGNKKAEFKAWESDYEDSDVDPNPDSSSDEEAWLGHPKPKKRICPKYNPNVDPRDFKWENGMTFTVPVKFKTVVIRYAAHHGVDVWYKKNDKTIIQVKCREGCHWRLWAAKVPDEHTWQLKTFVQEHTCSRSLRISLVKSRWLAELYGDRLRVNPFWKLMALKADIKTELGVDVTKNMCDRTRRRALSQLTETLKEHYKRMQDYLLETDRIMPGSHLVLRTRPETNKFLRFYICYQPLREAWKEGYRRVIGLDGCFLKTFSKGILVSAVGRDGNNQMFPIAWAVVEAENYETWLIAAVKELLLNAEHRNCARHIYANWRKKHPGVSLRAWFWKAAKASRVEDWRKYMWEIKKISQQAYDDLIRDQDPHTWSKAFFDTKSQCESVDKNMSETFNSWILEARYKPIILMLEDIRLQVMVRLQKKKDEMLKNNKNFGKRIVNRLDRSIGDSRNCVPYWNGDLDFEIKGEKGGFVVNLGTWHCECREWQLSGIPYCHAISAIFYMKEKPEDYVSNWFSKETYLKSYGHMLKPLNGINHWHVCSLPPIEPPDMRNLPGRPQVNRRKDASEHLDKNKPNAVPQTEDGTQAKKMTKKGMKIRCSICKQENHNKKTCPERPPITAEEVAECEQGRKRKRRPVPKKKTTSAPQSSNFTQGNTFAASVQREFQAINLQPSFQRQGMTFITATSLLEQVANRKG